jgi:uncharacterized protein HemX
MQTIVQGAEKDVTTPPPPPAATSSEAGRAFGVRTLWIAVVLALLVGAYAWYDVRRATQELRGDVAKRLVNVDAAVAQGRARDSDLANELRDAQAKLALLDARVAEFQSQQAALEALYRDLAPSRDELALSEVE